eukprot:TRINITY_DN775818_c0_g1_i1.p1 TRINITY_DN775818_c0_g1~~TRINITY_DN775818_c0_g1_i1.p1  ORF type:complete len:456 (+),score=120.99 TRINITY_DN775818_c0_g1_i1:69-1436(+)
MSRPARKLKVRTISRLEEDFTKKRSDDLLKVMRNKDESIHPLQRAREYQRGLNAIKIDKLFAKPFVGALSDHRDGVFCSTTSHKNLSQFISGACDGEIISWDLAHRKPKFRVTAHNGFVRGLSVHMSGHSFLSCGDDRFVKMWNINPDSADMSNMVPMSEWIGKSAFHGVDCNRADHTFLTSGDQIQVWNYHRSEPTNTFQWGHDTFTCAKFNPSETHIIGATCGDNSITLLDVRSDTPIRKLVLKNRSNALAWNPMEPFNFSVANEDYNCYTYDMRRMDSAMTVHHDHVGAVMDIAYSPTGREFVTGSYDRTIRIFPTQDSNGRSREVYHTARMQRIFCVNFSSDARFVLSGSDDTNVRLWKADANSSMAKLHKRAQKSRDYQASLVEKFKYMPTIRRIKNHRHLPKNLMKEAKKQKIMKDSQKRKLDNVRKNNKPGAVPYVSERRENIVKELE